MSAFTRQQLLKVVAFETLDPETETEIADVERELRVQFPSAYRQILGIGGEGHMGPLETVPDDDLHFNFLPMKRERFEYVSMKVSAAHKRILQSAGDMRRIIPFGAIGNGDHVCFDYRTSSVPAIVLWNHEKAFSCIDSLTSLAESFDEFLLLALKNG